MSNPENPDLQIKDYEDINAGKTAEQLALENKIPLMQLQQKSSLFKEMIKKEEEKENAKQEQLDQEKLQPEDNEPTNTKDSTEFPDASETNEENDLNVKSEANTEVETGKVQPENEPSSVLSEKQMGKLPENVTVPVVDDRKALKSVLDTYRNPDSIPMSAVLDGFESLVIRSEATRSVFRASKESLNIDSSQENIAKNLIQLTEAFMQVGEQNYDLVTLVSSLLQVLGGVSREVQALKVSTSTEMNRLSSMVPASITSHINHTMVASSQNQETTPSSAIETLTPQQHPQPAVVTTARKKKSKLELLRELAKK